MRYEVRGAESATGKDVRVEFEARDPEEARRLANYNGVMVESIGAAGQKKAAPVVSYADPATPRPAPNVTADVAPAYMGIVQGARLLNRVAARYRSMAWLLMVAAVLMAIGGIVMMVRGNPAGLMTILAAIAPAAISQVLFTRATTMVLVANVSEAIRDIARNTTK